MADIKISELLPASTPLDGTETLPIVQSGNTVKASTQDIASLYSLGYTAENVANKSTDSSFAGASDLKYPSQLAVKTYVDNTLGNAGWGLNGNSGTTPANFIGTIDATDFVIKTENSEQLRFKATGGGGNIETGYDFYSKNSSGSSIIAQSTSGNGFASLSHDTSLKGYLTLGNGSFKANLRVNNITSDRNLQLPNTNGTLVATVNNTAPDAAGNVTLSAGGGNTTTIKISLNSTQLQSISGINEIILIPSQTGKVICPISTFAVYTYGTIAYTSGVNILLKLASGSGAGIGNVNFGNVTSDIVAKLNNNNTISNAGVALNNYIAIGAIGGGSMGSGNGTLDLYITYAVL